MVQGPLFMHGAAREQAYIACCSCDTTQVCCLGWKMELLLLRGERALPSIVEKIIQGRWEKTVSLEGPQGKTTTCSEGPHGKTQTVPTSPWNNSLYQESRRQQIICSKLPLETRHLFKGPQETKPLVQQCQENKLTLSEVPKEQISFWTAPREQNHHFIDPKSNKWLFWKFPWTRITFRRSRGNKCLVRRSSRTSNFFYPFSRVLKKKSNFAEGPHRNKSPFCLGCPKK